MSYLALLLYVLSALCWLKSALIRTPTLRGAPSDIGEPSRELAMALSTQAWWNRMGAVTMAMATLTDALSRLVP
jgi:hypothetical protein